MKRIFDDLIFLGKNNKEERIFEGEIPLRKGMSYNSYLILDDKTVLFDTIEASLVDIFINDLVNALDGRSLDYLIIQHLEPDHTMAVEKIIKLFPNVTILISMMGLTFLKQFFPSLKTFEHFQIIKEDDTLELKNHKLHFIAAPMVHWPEVMITYDEKNKILFSADAFGSFTVFDELDSSMYPDYEELINEARRYYTNIVGKFGPQVLSLLKKASTIEIKMICPLHGPIHTKLITTFVDYYSKWASYKEEKDGVLLIATSIYGHTLNAAVEMQNILNKKNIKTELINLNNTNVTYSLSFSFIYKKIILFCPTFNMGLFPKMEEYLSFICAHNLTNKVFGVIENGTWAPNSKKLMLESLNKLHGNFILNNSITIKSKLSKENILAMEKMVDELMSL